MATATSKLQIIIDVLGDKAERGLKGIQGSLTQIGIAVGAATAAAYTAKKAWDFTKEAAQLDLTAKQFDNVANAAGYMSDTLLNDMREATSGMVTDAELMRSGLQIIELGLADSEQGVVDLATVVSTLGLDMQQVIMTFANDSVMRLDALGLSVETVTKRAKELEAQGFVGDAFDQAVLEGLQDRMAVLGDTAETTAGQMQIFENSLTNIVDQKKLDYIESLSGAITKVNQVAQANELLELAHQVGVLTEKEYKLANTFGDTAGWIKLLNDRLADHRALIGYAKVESADWDNKQRGLNNAVESGIGVSYELGHQVRDLGLTYEDGAVDARLMESAQADLNRQLTIAGQAYNSIAVGIGNATQANRDRIEYLTSGGGLLNEMDAAIQAAIKAGDWDLATKLNDELTKADVDFKLEAGDVDASEASERLQEELNISKAEADAIVSELESTLFDMTAQTYTLKFNLQTTGTIPGLNPVQYETRKTQNTGTPYASGTGGWMQVPGSSGQPYPITVHGGEMMNVVPEGQSAGGGNSVNWYGDAVFVSADEALSFVASMQRNASRNARSAMAGSGYAG